MNMENIPVSKHTVSFGLALAFSSVVNALLMIAKEKSPAVMAGMRRLTGHHWVTHAAVVVIIFILSGWLLAKTRLGQGSTMSVNRLIATMIAGVLTGGLIIFGFYLVAD
jgi:hypothetical protein